MAGLGLTAWMYLGFQATDLPEGVMRSDARVTVVETADGADFRPRAETSTAGLIFLPGGIVDPAAYAPLLQRIAAAGHPARLLYLPMHCACTDSQIRRLFERIQAVLAADPDARWVLAGHSRGGMLAARFVHESAAGPAGLALIGTTHPRDFSLADTAIPVTKIYGARDGIAGFQAMWENRHLLPAAARWVEIPGGNHVQFGYYRHQLGDDAATISREEQQRALERALLELLAGVG